MSQKNAVDCCSILTVGRIAVLAISSLHLEKNVVNHVTVQKHWLDDASMV